MASSMPPVRRFGAWRCRDVIHAVVAALPFIAGGAFLAYRYESPGVLVVVTAVCSPFYLMRRQPKASLMAFLAIGAYGLPWCYWELYRDPVRIAARLAIAGQTGRALAILDRLSVTRPGRTDVPALRAQILLSLGRDQEALDTVNLAIKKQPGNFDLLLAQVGVLAHRGEHDAALASCGQLMLLAPKDSRCRVAISTVLFLRAGPGDWEQAVRELDGPLGDWRLAGQKGELLLHRARLLRLLSRSDDARRDLNEAMRLSPRSRPVLAERAIQAALQGSSQEAAAARAEYLESRAGRERYLDWLIDCARRRVVPAPAEDIRRAKETDAGSE